MKRRAPLVEMWHPHEEVRLPLKRWQPPPLVFVHMCHLVGVGWDVAATNTHLSLFLSHMVRPPSPSGVPPSLGIVTLFAI